MQLGYNTNGLQNHRLDQAARLLADHGYQAIAITPDVMHLDPFRATAHEVDELAALLQRLHLLPVMESGARFLLDPRHKHEPTLMTRDPAGRQRRLDFYGRIAAIGRDLGARVVSFWSGVDRQPGPDSRQWLLDGVRAAGAAIAAHGLLPALEPEPGMAVETTAQWRETAAALGQDSPAMTLDIGHLYAVWEGEPVQVIAGCGASMAQVHLEDMRLGSHDHLPPGTGDVDFAGVLSALTKAGYRGPVCFELARSSHAAPELVAACARLWAGLGSGLSG